MVIISPMPCEAVEEADCEANGGPFFEKGLFGVVLLS